jgi:LmbE family N-acetylglucosaminyl deacetylase
MHILVIGAHPDDPEVAVGGTAIKFSDRGDQVKFVTVTNGNKGHFSDEYKADPNKLIDRRMAEAQAGAEASGAEFECLGVPDGEVFVNQELTEKLVEVIRTFGPEGEGPDLVLINRPCDYHRDHRYTSQSVLDASYMLTVPLYSPRIPHLMKMPVFAYWSDRFTEGGPFRSDVVIDIGDVLEQKAEAIAAHESQFFEWLPYNNRSPQLPPDHSRRMEAVMKYVHQRGRNVVAVSGEAAEGIEFAEAFQISEYGTQPNEEELATLFPG